MEMRIRGILVCSHFFKSYTQHIQKSTKSVRRDILRISGHIISLTLYQKKKGNDEMKSTNSKKSTKNKIIKKQKKETMK
jgi:hypothetical protein